MQPARARSQLSNGVLGVFHLQLYRRRQAAEELLCERYDGSDDGSLRKLGTTLTKKVSGCVERLRIQSSELGWRGPLKPNSDHKQKRFGRKAEFRMEVTSPAGEGRIQSSMERRAEFEPHTMATHMATRIH